MSYVDLPGRDDQNKQCLEKRTTTSPPSNSIFCDNNGSQWTRKRTCFEVLTEIWRKIKRAKMKLLCGLNTWPGFTFQDPEPFDKPPNTVSLLGWNCTQAYYAHYATTGKVQLWRSWKKFPATVLIYPYFPMSSIPSLILISTRSQTHYQGMETGAFWNVRCLQVLFKNLIVSELFRDICLSRSRFNADFRIGEYSIYILAQALDPALLHIRFLAMGQETV